VKRGDDRALGEGEPALVEVADGRCLAADYNALIRRTVAVCLDAEPAIVAVQAVVIDAARLMRDSAMDAVAVVDAQGRPAGVVTGSDLVSLLAK
jgi:signal-transduction protein with cAMP-binding, CBS, and nucleotidyltransferase domain